MIEYPPRAVVKLPNAPYGRYEVVLAGSAWVSGRELLAPGLRYVPGHKRVVSLEAGPDGVDIDAFGL